MPGLPDRKASCKNRSIRQWPDCPSSPKKMTMRQWYGAWPAMPMWERAQSSISSPAWIKSWATGRERPWSVLRAYCSTKGAEDQGHRSAGDLFVLHLLHGGAGFPGLHRPGKAGHRGQCGGCFIPGEKSLLHPSASGAGSSIDPGLESGGPHGEEEASHVDYKKLAKTHWAFQSFPRLPSKERACPELTEQIVQARRPKKNRLSRLNMEKRWKQRIDEAGPTPGKDRDRLSSPVGGH